MKKICFITPQFKTGGGNRVFIELSNELSKDNSVEIIYPRNSIEKNTFKLSEKVLVKSIGKYYNSKILKLMNMLYTLYWIRKNRNEYELIITDPLMSLFYFILPPKKLYRFVQADDYRIFDDKEILRNIICLNIYKILTKISYKSKKIKYIFNSKYTYEMFLKDSNNYVDYKLVHPAINKRIFFNKNIRKDNELNICIVARKHPWKGFITFINAWKSFKDKNKINKIYIISHDDLSKFDLDNELFEIVIPKSDIEISNIMNRSHIFISTSWWEGFGLPPLEAMACGVCTIISKSGGVNEYAIDNHNCLMYDPKDENQLVEKMEELVNNDLKRLEILKNSQKIINKFSWKQSSENFYKILNQKNKVND